MADGDPLRRRLADVGDRDVPVPAATGPGRPDIVLVSCVKMKLNRAAPARDLYTSPLFRKARRYAETSGARWFILSAEHGLVDPDEIIAPYDLRLSDTSVDYRRAWGESVVRQLTAEVGDLAGQRIEVHAGSAYTRPLVPLLRRLGAIPVEPLAHLAMGARQQWYDRFDAGTNGEGHGVTPVVGTRAVVAALRDQSRAQSPAEFLASGGSGLVSPGLYAWWVDAAGAADLTQGLGHLVRSGLVYAGQAGATRTISGRRSTNTLWGRISTMHLGSRAGLSTLRLTLGSVLAAASGADAIDEASLTEWMHGHLRVTTCAIPDADTLDAVETAVLRELDPPLNLAKMSPTPIRARLTELRRPHRSQGRPDANRPADRPSNPTNVGSPMGSRQVTDRNAVLLAMDECDRVGRDTFLERYGFGRSHTYVLMHEGRAYDSKAILGVAHKYQYGEPLEAGTFNGGKHETALVLRRLGFEVTGP